MENIAPCPSCKSLYAYELDGKLVCPECGFEWVAEEVVAQEEGLIVKDSNGTITF